MDNDNIIKHLEVMSFMDTNKLNQLLLLNKTAGSRNDFLRSHDWYRIDNTNMYALTYEIAGKKYLSKIYMMDDDNLGIETSNLYGGKRNKLKNDDALSTKNKKRNVTKVTESVDATSTGPTESSNPTDFTNSTVSKRKPNTARKTVNNTVSETSTSNKNTKNTKTNKKNKNNEYTSDLMGMTHKIK